MKVKTGEAEGEVLNYLVAKAEGMLEVIHDTKSKELWYYDKETGRDKHFWPSTDWALAGPIIEREGVCMMFSPKDARGAWYCVMGKNRFLSPDFEGSGPTALVAAMRCFVTSKLGNEVEISNE
jgi:hypothetical protein